ncbi:MAG: glycosyltransferase family 2 protein, partial [Deltaproteobacteria bacterium]|nr:glycosyltransferase family 2 protein [Deltaproteobacteria bacterium]
MKQDTIAVIITCYNRKEKTVECLRRLKQNRLPKGYAVVIILVDDNSTDRTADAILEEYPATQIIKGDGNLYWNGGMRTGIAAALKGKADFHLWLNDDTLLFSNAVESLLRCYEKVQTDLGAAGIIVGSTCDELTGEPTYGGLVRRSPWRAVKFELVSPRDSYQECETMNGNCVLVPRSVAEKIGNLEERFAHGMGDLDYGLRAKNTGYW